jgi:DNA-binding NarL/FixJ family response regulator
VAWQMLNAEEGAASYGGCTSLGGRRQCRDACIGQLVLGQDPDLVLIGEAEDGGSAVVFARQHRPDLVVMDLLMPRVEGLDATRQIKSEWPDGASRSQCTATFAREATPSHVRRYALNVGMRRRARRTTQA